MSLREKNPEFGIVRNGEIGGNDGNVLGCEGFSPTNGPIGMVSLGTNGINIKLQDGRVFPDGGLIDTEITDAELQQ